MKQIYLLRHAQKDNNGELTSEGKEIAKSLQNKLPKFKFIIASDSPRTQETAFLLTGIHPQVDLRAGYFKTSQEISDAINKEAQVNPNGFTGAYLANSDIKEKVIKKASGLVDLIYDILNKLGTEEKALIVSHDITLVPTARLLNQKVSVQSFKYLSGYIIDEDKNFTLFSL